MMASQVLETSTPTIGKPSSRAGRPCKKTGRGVKKSLFGTRRRKSKVDTASPSGELSNEIVHELASYSDSVQCVLDLENVDFQNSGCVRPTHERGKGNEICIVPEASDCKSVTKKPGRPAHKKGRGISKTSLYKPRRKRPPSKKQCRDDPLVDYEGDPFGDTVECFRSWPSPIRMLDGNSSLLEHSPDTPRSGDRSLYTDDSTFLDISTDNIDESVDSYKEDTDDCTPQKTNLDTTVLDEVNSMSDDTTLKSPLTSFADYSPWPSPIHESGEMSFHDLTDSDVEYSVLSDQLKAISNSQVLLTAEDMIDCTALSEYSVKSTNNTSNSGESFKEHAIECIPQNLDTTVLDEMNSMSDDSTLESPLNSFEDYSPWPSPIHESEELSLYDMADSGAKYSVPSDQLNELSSSQGLLTVEDDMISGTVLRDLTTLSTQSGSTDITHTVDGIYSMISEVPQEFVGNKYLGPTINETDRVLWLSPVPLEKPDPNSVGEITDGEGSSAHEFYIILDHVYKYNPEDVERYNVEVEDNDVVPTVETDRYKQLKDDVRQILSAENCMFVLVPGKQIHIAKHYYESDTLGIQCSVKISESGEATVFVHQRQISKDHDIWLTLPKFFSTTSDISKLLKRLNEFQVCAGNYDDDFIKLVAVGAGLSIGDHSSITAYREGNFGNQKYTTTVRTMKCDLLVRAGERCRHCRVYRGTLRKKMSRAREVENKAQQNPLSWKKPHAKQTKNELITKLESYKKYTRSIQDRVERLERDFAKQLTSRGEIMNQTDNNDMMDMVNQYSKDVEEAYRDPTSHQRIFWEAQKKYNSLRNKKSMRWHPAVIKWCIYMRSKSSQAYESMRRSGFVALPSERTLYDYTHAMPSKLGFQHEYVDHLIGEAKAKGLYEDASRGFVGLLQDEMRIKEDLVYDRVSGELVGYVDLDKSGNQLADLEQTTTESKRPLAKSVLVLMVRGLTSNLKYPLAVFATSSVTADQLYPIIWKAVEVLECDCDLKVLCITCDGATPNRKFFKMHQNEHHGAGPAYWTMNPFSLEERKIYFISDVPHLIKTARNCFANSFSHRRSRKLWKGGKDISWGHIVSLYEQYVEPHLYTEAHKPTRAHIDLTAFSQMKVSLAAQVLSKTVADALELHFDERQSETVKFIRHMNKFFDCLNTRARSEGRNKRNNDLESYTDPNDERLVYLLDDFLGYFVYYKFMIKTTRPTVTLQLFHCCRLSLQYTSLSSHTAGWFSFNHKNPSPQINRSLDDQRQLVGLDVSDHHTRSLFRSVWHDCPQGVNTGQRPEAKIWEDVLVRGSVPSASVM